MYNFLLLIDFLIKILNVENVVDGTQEFPTFVIVANSITELTMLLIKA